eukprot:CAMPEP_0119555902 /NCGR_PEP_ID=MMETSP1352-20130426/7989_1 /TAXON_ID=265584 /ORGANISM="Stauroneis constricta, Strain CCMP1120" /LENGTH=344 /DNA_ID=CAMNT_0007602761 /DNA_START=118 /DNA_END=1152 /DNA_ORIENTATION=+
MTPPTLYHVPRTISSPIVQCLLELNLLTTGHVRVEEISFADLKTPSYLQINPMGTSPAFRDDDDDVTMWESGAILDYLLEEYDEQHLLHPGTSGSSSRKVRANYLQIKQLIIATVYPTVAKLFLQTLKPADEQDADFVQQATTEWNERFGPILTKWVADSGGPYLLGKQVNAIDFLVAKPLNNCVALGLLDDFPILQNLFGLVQSRDSFRQAYSTLDSNTARRNGTNVQAVETTCTSQCDIQMDASVVTTASVAAAAIDDIDCTTVSLDDDDDDDSEVDEKIDDGRYYIDDECASFGDDTTPNDDDDVDMAGSIVPKQQQQQSRLYGRTQGVVGPHMTRQRRPS